MFRKFAIAASSVLAVENGFLLVSANNYFSKAQNVDKPRLFLMSDTPDEKGEPEITKLAEFNGKNNLLFQMTSSCTFLGLDNGLFVSDNFRSWRRVLETEKRGNIFWHMVEARNGDVFVHEYGEPPTAIYRSTNSGDSWEKVTSSETIDSKSRHFHCIAYDHYRNRLLATLGDGNLMKIVFSDDYGDTWHPCYASAYQCLPITVLEDQVVFGMDSGIGAGILVWYPSKDTWESIHLRYFGTNNFKDSLQSADLKRLNDGAWMMSTGCGSILFSHDLRNWQIICSGNIGVFQAHMLSDEHNHALAVAMGDATVLIDLRKLRTTSGCVDIKQYAALFSRLRGGLYVAKRKVQYFFT